MILLLIYLKSLGMMTCLKMSRRIAKRITQRTRQQRQLNSLSNANNHVVVKSFSGATTSDMEDYLKPIVRREPEEIILHVGTNDLKLMSDELVADGFINLAIQIRENSPSTKVTISSILPRTDKTGLSDKISLINKRLKSFCEQNNLDQLEHRAIDLTCLNGRGLHLNGKETSFLARSITNYITSN